MSNPVKVSPVSAITMDRGFDAGCVGWKSPYPTVVAFINALYSRSVVDQPAILPITSHIIAIAKIKVRRTDAAYVGSTTTIWMNEKVKCNLASVQSIVAKHSANFSGGER